jgi:hypothetical protein
MTGLTADSILLRAEHYEPMQRLASPIVLIRLWRYTLAERAPIGFPIASWTVIASQGQLHIRRIIEKQAQPNSRATKTYGSEALGDMRGWRAIAAQLTDVASADQCPANDEDIVYGIERDGRSLEWARDCRAALQLSDWHRRAVAWCECRLPATHEETVV